ncbi:MAG: hypothetical protein ACRDZZ_09790 [Ilumatobacteraceae bacterium]
MTQSEVSEVIDDERLARLLSLIQAGDEADQLADNATLSKALRWSLEDVAAYLADAKERMFIWGARGGSRPAPYYSELEVTVQGRRFLAAHRGVKRARD